MFLIGWNHELCRVPYGTLGNLGGGTDECHMALLVGKGLNKDCGRHSGSVQVEVCKLEWETFTKSDLKTFSDIDIILAAGMQALLLYIYIYIDKR